MSMLQRRLQILVDEERQRRIVAAARERGMPVGAVVRDAIDRGLTAAGADAVVSADRAFAELPALAHVLPDADGVAALLR